MPSSRRPLGFCAIAGGKHEQAQATQGGHRCRYEKAGSPTLRLDHQARAERAERRAAP